MKKIHCNECKFSEFTTANMSNAAPGNALGCCRKNPPVPIVIVQRTALGQGATGIQPVFPPVFETDWCGSGEQKEGLRLVN